MIQVSRHVLHTRKFCQSTSFSVKIRERTDGKLDGRVNHIKFQKHMDDFQEKVHFVYKRHDSVNSLLGGTSNRRCVKSSPCWREFDKVANEAQGTEADPTQSPLIGKYLASLLMTDCTSMHPSSSESCTPVPIRELAPRFRCSCAKKKARHDLFTQ